MCVGGYIAHKKEENYPYSPQKENWEDTSSQLWDKIINKSYANKTHNE
jgi:hypothetical protein